MFTTKISLTHFTSRVFHSPAASSDDYWKIYSIFYENSFSFKEIQLKLEKFLSIISIISFLMKDIGLFEKGKSSQAPNTNRIRNFHFCSLLLLYSSTSALSIVLVDAQRGSKSALSGSCWKSWEVRDCGQVVNKRNEMKIMRFLWIL